jgi:hypothetical protein
MSVCSPMSHDILPQSNLLTFLGVIKLSSFRHLYTIVPPTLEKTSKSDLRGSAANSLTPVLSV